jgi:hypothetical protein
MATPAGFGKGEKPGYSGPQTGGFISGHAGTTPTPPPAVDISQGRLRTPLGSMPILAVMMVFGGLYLLWFGVHYWRSTVKWPSDPLKAVLAGTAAPKAQPAVPTSANIAVASSGQGMIPEGVSLSQYQTFAAGWHAAGTDTTLNNQALGQQMAAASGWTGSEWQALHQLWDRISGWQTTAQNTATGGYGIPGAKPGSAMAAAGADWATNPATQIVWGIGYIRSTYGTPSAAYAHYIAKGSY